MAHAKDAYSELLSYLFSASQYSDPIPLVAGLKVLLLVLFFCTPFGTPFGEVA
jgi:hypothetical protein